MRAWEAKPAWVRTVVYVLMVAGFALWFGGTITGQARSLVTAGRVLFFVMFAVPLGVISRALRQ